MATPHSEGYMEPIPRPLVESYLLELGLPPRIEQHHRCAVGSLDRFLLCEFATLEETGRETLLAYREWLLGRYSPTTARWYWGSVKRFLSWASARGACEDVAQEIRVEGGSGPRRSVLEYDEALAVLGRAKEACSTLAGQRDYAIASLMLRCALRPAEIHEADVVDLSLDSEGAASLAVREWGGEGKGRVIALEAEATKALLGYLRARGRLSLHEPLFASCSNRSLGCRLSERSIRETMKNLLTGAEPARKEASATSLRLSAPMFALEGGTPLADVCRFARSRNLAYGPVPAWHLEQASELEPRPCHGASFLVSRQELLDMAGPFRPDDWLVPSIDPEGLSIELAPS